MAAEAYQTSKSTEWIPAIKSLLGDRNEMTRLRAAELLACCDQTSARTALVGALDGPNQLIRNEAARILEAKGLADPTVARRLLGDPFEGVRLYGAGATLLAAAVPAR
jgi:HEAT repeat protein